MNIEFKCPTKRNPVEESNEEDLFYYKAELLDSSEKCIFNIQIEMAYFCRQISPSKSETPQANAPSLLEHKFCSLVEKVDYNLMQVYNLSRLSTSVNQLAQFYFKICSSPSLDELKAKQKSSDCFITNSNDNLILVESAFRTRLTYSLESAIQIKTCRIKRFVIDFLCDKSQESKMDLVTFDAGDKAVVEFRSKYACPVKKLIEIGDYAPKCLYYPYNESNKEELILAENINIEIENKMKKILDLTESQFFYTQISISISDKNFVLNLCNSSGLGSTKTANTCPSTNSICFFDSLSARSNPISIGSLNSSNLGSKFYYRLSVSKNSIYFLFLNGSSCKENPKLNYSSQINLICKPDVDESTPEFSHFNSSSCRFYFDWPSSLPCFSLSNDTSSGQNKPALSNASHQCIIYNQLHRHTFNLTSLYVLENPYRLSTSRFEYQINVCAPPEHLIKPTNISITRKDFKSGKTVVFAYFHQMSLSHLASHLVLSYEGDMCDKTQKRTVLIIFECSPFNDMEPVISEESECEVTFTWSVRTACVFKLSNYDKSGNSVSASDCSVYYADHLYDVRPLVHMLNSWKVVNGSDIYLLNICKGNFYSFF